MNEVEAVRSRSQMVQVEALLTKHSDIYLDVWKFGINTALRISDLLSISTEQARGLDDANPVLKLREQKTGKVRSILLNTAAYAIIQKRLLEEPNDMWLFQSKRRMTSRAAPQPISRRSVARIFELVGANVVLRVQLSTHSMRKTRGHALHAAGFSIEAICRVLNHSNTSVTMRYIGLTQADVDKSFTDLVL